MSILAHLNPEYLRSGVKRLGCRVSDSGISVWDSSPTIALSSRFLLPLRGFGVDGLGIDIEVRMVLKSLEKSLLRYASSVLDLRTTTSQKCEAVPSRARIEGS